MDEQFEYEQIDDNIEDTYEDAEEAPQGRGNLLVKAGILVAGMATGYAIDKFGRPVMSWAAAKHADRKARKMARREAMLEEKLERLRQKKEANTEE